MDKPLDQCIICGAPLEFDRIATFRTVGPRYSWVPQFEKEWYLIDKERLRYDDVYDLELGGWHENQICVQPRDPIRVLIGLSK